MPLAERFAAIFDHPDSRSRLLDLSHRAHTTLPTFNLATTSLRHMPKWYERLSDINAGGTDPHSNFLSDPAAIGLVDTLASPPELTPVGRRLAALDPSIKADRKRGEYALIKELYFSRVRHRPAIAQFLAGKRANLDRMLNQFVPTPSRQLFLTHPSLLALAELLTDFPGAIRGLLALSEADLLALAELGEGRFERLCSDPRFPPGLERLCRRIGSDYRRGQERRLNYIVSMALCEIASLAPVHGAGQLTLPPPFSQFLTEVDIHNLYAEYAKDLAVWFDGANFYVSRSLAAETPASEPVIGHRVSLRLGRGRGRARAAEAPAAYGRSVKRGRRSRATFVILDPYVGEYAEDWIETRVLRPTYGAALFRAGHRSGEVMPLPDGMVPGADFYVLNTRGNPTEFIEVKSISGPPPSEISLTRAEYARALRCRDTGIPYRLILVDVLNEEFYEVDDFVRVLTDATLEDVIRFSLSVG